MKNKGKIIIIIITLIVILAGLIIYSNTKTKYNQVEKFTMCKIIDSTQIEINNYQENKMPFTIESTDDVEIMINGIKYEKGKRIYKTGKYEIKISNKERAEKATVYIKDIERSNEHEYNIYSVLTTLPTLFSSMNIVKNPEQQGYYWTKRISTIDIEKLREHCPNLEISEYINIQSEENYDKSIDMEMKSYVERILKQDPNAYFIVHVDEFRFYAEFPLFAELGLTDNRYSINIYTDGTLSYTRKYEIAEERKYEKFQEEKKTYEDLLKQIRSNTYDSKKIYKVAEYLMNSKSYENYNYNYLLISTLKDNVNYLLQYPDLIKFEDKRVAKEMEKANFSKIVAQEQFSEISEDGKNIFFDLINFNKQEMDEKYFNQQDKGDYLIITGAKPFYGTVTQKEFEEYIGIICDKYKDKYTILYKPHPSALPDEEQEKFLTYHNIKVLPGRIPMEAISYIYPNLKLGGFASSLYMSVDEGKTLFFFARNKELLVDPLNILYDDLFSNAEFIH